MDLNQITQLGAVGLFALLSFIQIAPIKINPWSFIGRGICRVLFGELIDKVDNVHDKVDHVQKSLDEHIIANEERDVKQCRLRVLRFNDEIIQGQKHTREHFNEILDDITEYEHYCDDHPDYENSKAVLAIENVKRIYRQCEEDNSFL